MLLYLCISEEKGEKVNIKGTRTELSAKLSAHGELSLKQASTDFKNELYNSYCYV
jgi:hypothetical protein